MTTMTTREIRLGSSPMFHTPGMVRWMSHCYQHGGTAYYTTTPELMVKMVLEGWPGAKLTLEDAHGLLSGAITYNVEDGESHGTVVFEVTSTEEEGDLQAAERETIGECQPALEDNCEDMYKEMN
jgi:hypothetical protein